MLNPNKWNEWSKNIWVIAFATIPVAIFLIIKYGFVQVPVSGSSFRTQTYTDAVVIISSSLMVASAFIIAAFFGLINDIYKRSFTDEEIKASEKEDKKIARNKRLTVSIVSESSPLAGKVKAGWAISRVNGYDVVTVNEVREKLIKGVNELYFISDNGEVRPFQVNLNGDEKLGLTFL